MKGRLTMVFSPAVYARQLAEFEKMVSLHDPAYEYSPDHGLWRRGLTSETAIRRFAHKLKPNDVVRIWNAEVDRKIEDVKERKEFYWNERNIKA
jgi:hypothetical protein